MAKRRPIKTTPEAAVGGAAAVPGRPFASEQRSLSPASLLGMGAALIAAAVVDAGYWPSDSIAVQIGEARYLVGLLLGAAALVMWVRGSHERGDWLIDALAWGLALWMLVATWANAEGANLRLAVNELWWWIAAAALLSAARRCVSLPPVKQSLVYLIFGVTVGVAVYGWHQLLIDFPNLIEQYKADPEAVLREAGIVAEAGSAQRVIFENRLYDGGPTGTFALANSMAALLVGGLVVMIGWVSQRWRELSILYRLSWGGVILITLGMLLASRSRSAVVALILVAGLYGGLRLVGSGQRIFRQQRRSVLIGALATLVLASGVVAAVAWQRWSHSEWISQAPASVAIRLNYWRACARMVAQSPLVGVGPGQFKARYEAFRVPESTEQIADPHNWFWQAITTGGIPAGLLLSALFAVTAWRAIGFAPPTPDPNPELPDETEAPGPSAWRFSPGWIYAGAGAAALAVWLVGAAIGYLPDFDAAMLATLVAIGVIVLAISTARSTTVAAPDNRALGRLALWGLAAMVIDLLAAGGLTVPGVAVTLWIFAAVAAPWSGGGSLSADGTVAEPPANSRRQLCYGGAAAVLLAGWYFTAIRPVQQVALATGQFESAWAQRSSGVAEAALRRAMEADPWDADSALKLAQLLMQQALVAPPQRERLEAAWKVAEAEALRRGGEDPANLRVLGDAWLWYYQRYDDAAALQRAAELYRRAVELSPSHQSYAAQLAEVYRKLDDPQAGEVAGVAQTLSQIGGYHERTLPYIIVLVAEPVGEAALAGPAQRPASEALAPLLSPPN